MIRRFKYFAVALTVLLLGGLLTSNPAMAAYPTSPSVYYFGTDYCNNWPSQTCIAYPASAAGTWILYSSNGRDRLGFGGSGNFAGYVNGTSTVWFSSNTAGAVDRIAFQRDCNVVIYENGSNQVLWAAGSQIGQTSRRCRLTMGGDGHFSIWEDADASGIWYRIITWGNGA